MNYNNQNYTTNLPKAIAYNCFNAEIRLILTALLKRPLSFQREITLISLLALPSMVCYAQTMTETVNYINKAFKSNDSDYEAVFNVDSTGTIEINLTSYFGRRGYSGVYEAYPGRSTYEALPFDIWIDHSDPDPNKVSLRCFRQPLGTSYLKCFNLTGEAQKKEGSRVSVLDLLIPDANSNEVEHLLNALNHLLELCKELNSKYKLTEAKSNPFVSRTDLANRIKMVKIGNVYQVPVEINNVLKIKFILDTGASDVFLSLDVFSTLLRSETLTQNDYLGTAIYSFANGKTEECKLYKLRSLKIGNKTVKDVRCGIANSLDVDMLLGQSFLQELGGYRIDNSTHELILD